MGFAVTTDHEAIRALLDAVIAADPVGGTVLGTIATSLEDTAFCATDGDRLAVRSSAERPLALAGGWDASAAAAVAALVASLGGVQAVSGVVAAVDVVAPALFGDRPTAAMNQLLFRLDELTAPDAVPGHAGVATTADRDLVQAWYAAFAQEAGVAHPGTERMADAALAGGLVQLWRDASDETVSMAVRRPVIAGSARIGPVYTPPAQRGRGYGAAVTAAATRSVLDEGAVPVLFTDVANPTSNKIYRRLGYRPVEYHRMVRVS